MAPTAASTSSTRVADADHQVELGRVVGAHGLRGELRVQTASPDTFRTGLRVRLRGADDASSRTHEVESARPGRAGECRVRLAGVGHREAAEALRGSVLWALARELPALPPGEFYQHELVGCRAFAPDGRALGVVRSIWETGAPDVLVIEQTCGRELLVPAAEPLLHEVDVPGRRIVIELPPGLLDEA